MPLQRDIIIGNRYQVLRALGEGGMGAAHLVEDRRLGRQCVIKEVLSHNTGSHAQFEREAQILAQLQHPNLPRVYDFFFEGQSPYLIMDYVKGDTLDNLQSQRSAPFEISDVLNWARDLLNALKCMHEHSSPVIHRDIKPHNVCITPAGDAILLDFGIARKLDESKTNTAAQAFTQGYAPIEQYPENEVRISPKVFTYWKNLRAEDIHTGLYSDIYSLGATLYYALTLLPVAPAPMRVLDDEIQPIQQHNANVPDYLAGAVMKALAIHPKERFQSTAEMLAALQPEAQATPSVQLRPRSQRSLPTGNVTVLDQELIYVPRGEFLIGTQNPEIKEACHPQHQVKLGAYCIGRFPVTNDDYQRFIDNNAEIEVPYSSLRVAQPSNWDHRSRTFPRGLEEHPVVLVSWQEALAYCRWLSDVTGYRCRLPTEADWEKAAAWDSAAGQTRAYPWGDSFDDQRCNVDSHGALRLKSNRVGQFSPDGDSPYGLADIAGNVWEWTGSLYQPYPYDASDGRNDPDAEGQRVVRGGAFDELPSSAYCAWRQGVPPHQHSHNTGFRVLCEAE